MRSRNTWLTGLIAFQALVGYCGASLAQLPTSGAFTAAPDDWLLGTGQSWHYRTRVAESPLTLVSRSPRGAEERIIEQAKKVLALPSARALALVSGNEVVWIGYRPPAGEDKLFLSFSIGKTITSMAIGKLICRNLISLETLAHEHIPELSGSDLGLASVRDLLRMSSGTWEGNPDSTVFSVDQAKAINLGTTSILDAISSKRVNSADSGTFGSKRKPGQVFAYKSSDPLVLGILINRVSGMTYAGWVEDAVLIPSGIAAPATIGQDRFGFGGADGNVRLRLNDWIRVAIWVKRAESEPGCFGDYVRAAATTQISNASKRFGKLFDGYGYLLWTENNRLRQSYWAVGHGGQRIAWNRRNDRILVAFSAVEDYMDDLYKLYADWAALP